MINDELTKKLAEAAKKVLAMIILTTNLTMAKD